MAKSGGSGNGGTGNNGAGSGKGAGGTGRGAGQGNAGGWPSTHTGQVSGGNRSNAPPAKGK